MPCQPPSHPLDLTLTDEKECSSTEKFRDTTVSAHMVLCRARCSRCFYSEINTLKYPCYCSDERRAGWVDNYGYDRGGNSTVVDRLLCRNCIKMGDADRMEHKANRDRVKYTNLTQQSLACSKCNEALPLTGALWWICSKCSGECRSSDHPGWKRKLEI